MPNLKQEICLYISSTAELPEINEGPWFLNLRGDEGICTSLILYVQLSQFCHNRIKNKYNLVIVFGELPVGGG